jgi:hypothetical protein
MSSFVQIMPMSLVFGRSDGKIEKPNCELNFEASKNDEWCCNISQSDIRILQAPVAWSELDRGNQLGLVIQLNHVVRHGSIRRKKNKKQKNYAPLLSIHVRNETILLASCRVASFSQQHDAML